MKTERVEDEEYESATYQWGGEAQKRRKTEQEAAEERLREKGRKRKVENIEYGMPLTSVTLSHEQWSAEAQQTLHSAPKETRVSWNAFANNRPEDENEPHFGFGAPQHSDGLGEAFSRDGEQFGRAQFHNHHNDNNNDNNNNNNNDNNRLMFNSGGAGDGGRGLNGNGFFGADIDANHSFPNNAQREQQQQMQNADEDGSSCSMDWEETPAQRAVANCPDDFNHPYKEVNLFLKTLTFERINMSELRRSSRV